MAGRGQNKHSQLLLFCSLREMYVPQRSSSYGPWSPWDKIAFLIQLLRSTWLHSAHQAPSSPISTVQGVSPWERLWLVYKSISQPVSRLEKEGHTRWLPLFPPPSTARAGRREDRRHPRVGVLPPGLTDWNKCICQNWRQQDEHRGSTKLKWWRVPRCLQFWILLKEKRGPVRWLSDKGACLPTLPTWVRAPGPTWGEEKTDACKLTFNLCTPLNQ